MTSGRHFGFLAILKLLEFFISPIDVPGLYLSGLGFSAIGDLRYSVLPPLLLNPLLIFKVGVFDLIELYSGSYYPGAGFLSGLNTYLLPKSRFLNERLLDDIIESKVPY